MLRCITLRYVTLSFNALGYIAFCCVKFGRSFVVFLCVTLRYVMLRDIAFSAQQRTILFSLMMCTFYTNGMS